MCNFFWYFYTVFNMTKIIILLALLAYSTGIFAQKPSIIVDGGVNTCYGAANIFSNGSYRLQFTGKKNVNSLVRYKSLQTVETDNQLWVSFIAPTNGELNFKASIEDGFVQMVVFDQLKKEICNELKTGVAEVNRLYIKKDKGRVGVSKETGNGFLYTIKLKEGQKINIVFATSKGKKDILDLIWEFTPEIIENTDEKIVDKRFDDFAPTFAITIRDKETKKPIVASISIEGNRTINGTYRSSDLFFNLERKCKLKIKTDVTGYFFIDTLISGSSFDNQEIVLYLSKIESGHSISIEDIEFQPGTSVITESSIPKLKRLRDFLLLNSDLRIEIQGHVDARGDNSHAGQKISEARAKRVKIYLIENGISKDRLTTKGYGNTRPIYPDPKFSYEEQANRRVEILVL